MRNDENKIELAESTLHLVLRLSGGGKRGNRMKIEPALVALAEKYMVKRIVCRKYSP